MKKNDKYFVEIQALRSQIEEQMKYYEEELKEPGDWEERIKGQIVEDLRILKWMDLLFGKPE